MTRDQIAEELPNLAESKLTALVVDDSFVNQTIHQKLLNRLGIENDVVTNGKEAVDVYCSGRNYDLILMDMDMPIMNGIQVTNSLYFYSLNSSLLDIKVFKIEFGTKFGYYLYIKEELFLESNIFSFNLSKTFRKKD